MELGMDHLVIGVVCAVLSGGVVWSVVSARARAGAVRLRSELEALRGEGDRLEVERVALKDELVAVQVESVEAGAVVARLEAELVAEQRRGREKVELLNKAEEKFGQTFEALSAKALRSSQEQFLEMAGATLKGQQTVAAGELEKREQAVAQLVKPLGETLEKMEGKIGELEKSRQGAYAGLKEQVKQVGEINHGLQKETAQLVKALRQPTGRGQWGELQLRRVVEMAGMIEYCDFQTQVSVQSDKGQLRPDMVVQLPGGQKIVVDAKATMDAYLDATEAESEELRAEALQRHVEQVKTQMKQLSQKKYYEQFSESPEFVVLFLPSEAFFSAALAQDGTLIEKSTQLGVVLATPTTLIALLRAVAQGWKQESLAKNAREISEVGAEFYRRMLTFVGHLDKLGHSLEGSVKSYNQAIGSLEGRLLGSARKLEDLGVAGEQAEVTPPARVETGIRVRKQLGEEGGQEAGVNIDGGGFILPDGVAGVSAITGNAEPSDGLWAEFEGFETDGAGGGI